MYKFYLKSKARVPLRANIAPLSRMTCTALLVFLLFNTALHAQTQQVTLKETNAPLKKIFHDIGKQTGLEFLASSTVLSASKPVTIDVKNQPLTIVLEQIFKDQPLQYEVRDKIIVVTLKEKQSNPKYSSADQRIYGIISDENDKPLPGATIKIKGTGLEMTSASDGTFSLTTSVINPVLIISFVGYSTYEYAITSRDQFPIKISIVPQTSSLNQVQIIGYGTTTKRFNTGSTGTVSAKEIEDQPVSNPLAAIQGKISGVLVQTQNGLPGGGIKVQIRGQGSLASGTDPLYIVDGVPFLSTAIAGNTAVSGANGAISPLSIINPDDIQRIDVLKDADATAIYGSRAANGVVLITTKRGSPGKDRVTFDFSEGISKISRLDNQVLNLPQYLKLRREAYANDGLTPDIYSAPDLLLWDTTKSTNWQKYFYGGTAHVTTVRTSLSGGDQSNSYLLSLNYRNEGTILPGDERYLKGGGYFNFHHSSTDRKFDCTLAVSYDKDDNKTVYALNNQVYTLPPDLPIYNADGTYNWDYDNPVAALSARQESKTDYLNVNNIYSYHFNPSFNAQVSLGYNSYQLDQVAKVPVQAINPAFDPVPTAYFGNNMSQKYIIEPQLNYKKQLGKGSISALLGGTYQSQLNTGSLVMGQGVSNPALLGNYGAATTLSNQTNSYTLYKYASLFSRVTYNLSDKYILDLNFRRDGSSRFGANREFGNFYAVGAAWLFTEEHFFKKALPWLSYGKLRGSFGTTGNDQISDYQYLASYGAGPVYGGSATLSPSRVANPNYSWETTHKYEGAVELGFFQDRVLFSVNYFDHISNNQLIQYKLPLLSGFASYQANFPAVIQNNGWEFDLSATIFKGNAVSWKSSVNATIPHNVLKSFPSIESSSYANTYRVGQDLSLVKGYQLVGIDPQTGQAVIKDQNGDGVISVPADVVVLGKTSPTFFGGWSNTFNFKNMELSFTAEFMKRMYPRTQAQLGSLPYNDPTYVLNRWEKPGDIASVPRASVTLSPAQYNSTTLVDATYIRLKNVALSYNIPEYMLKYLGVQNLKIYADAENLFVIANKDRFDPEISGTGISPMKTIVFGLKTSF